MQPPVDKAGHKLLVQSGQEEVEKWAVTMADNSMPAYQYTQLVYCIASPISHANAYVCNFVLPSHALGCGFQHDACFASRRYCEIRYWAAIEQVLCTSIVAACMVVYEFWLVHGMGTGHAHLALALTSARALALGMFACGQM